VALPVRAVPENLTYLRTKRDRMGHDLPELDEAAAGRTDDAAGAGHLPGGAAS